MRIEFQGIGKRFPGTVALDDVSFTIASGSCHALCGENGAGKSTLGKILAGVHSPDRGSILLDGRPVRIDSPRAALAAGIGMVHQELALCDNLTVAENLCLERLPSRAGFWFARADSRKAAQRMLDAVGAGLPVDALAGTLSVWQQQLVQIAIAVGGGARAVVFDEPTSSLGRHEAEKLFELIARLKAQGVTCIYVSHRMDELERLCDTATVLRDGRHVATRPMPELSADSHRELIRLMIGREVSWTRDGQAPTLGGEVLRAAAITSPGRLHDVDLVVRAGEIVGLAGLVGAGRSELAAVLAGLDRSARGRVAIKGRDGIPRSVADALARGLALVPEDRKRQAIIPGMSCRANLTLPRLGQVAPWGLIPTGRERAHTAEWFKRLGVRAASPEIPIASLSGGNQQKVILARWLAAQADILVLDEPTRGVDIGAKAEIHGLVRELARAGKAVLLISSELPELLALAHRIVVLRGGRVAGELAGDAASQEEVLRLMAVA